jgi:hypothetical protein
MNDSPARDHRRGSRGAYGPAILKYNNVNYVTKRKDPATDGELDGLLACRGGNCKGNGNRAIKRVP